MKLVYCFIITGVFCSLAAGLRAQTPVLPTEACQIFCTYKLTFQPDSTDAFRRSELLRLMLGKTTSEFQSLGSFLTDSLYTTTDDVQTVVDKNASLPRSRFYYRIYKNRATNTIYPYDKIGGQLYRYPESAPLFNWKISAETAKIAGYACQKATAAFAGRVFEAWFTREVPLSDGPYKFYGLPGLIVKVGDTRQQYVFELVKLAKPARELLIALPRQPATLTTKPTFQRAQRDYYTNLPNLVSSATQSGTPGDVQTLRNSVRKKYNNALEIR